MAFGEYLKGELEYRGMLVKELAHATGIPKQTLDKYLLTNGAMPSAENAVAIAQALGVTVEFLVTGSKATRLESARLEAPLSSPEARSIAAHVAALSSEKRKIVEKAVEELVGILREPPVEEPSAFTTLQKVFLRLFR